MKLAAAAVSALVLSGAAAAAGADVTPPASPALQQDGNFCSGRPTDVDTRIAAAVNALGVSAPTTPPIAVLDTGVNDDFPELAGRLVAPFDATTGGSDGSDVDGHGSEVAGLAAGAAGLVQGVSPTSPIIPVRIYNRTGDTTIQWLIGGISWAVQNHAAVINVSSSEQAADATPADVAALTRAVTDAFNSGTLVVASVGNDGNSSETIPASLPHVIGVGASDLLGNRSTFSNTGPWVDLVSPAASMVAPLSSAFCPSGYGVANGTSYAAPAVAGAAALLAQLRPSLTTQQRFEILTRSAHDVDPAGRDDDTGYGLLNVANAMSMQPPMAESSPEVDDDPYYVRGPFAGSHPVLLSSKRRARLAGEISPARDPSDVYRVRVKKGERLTVSASVAGPNALASLSVLKPSAGDFDVSNDVTKNEVVSTGGFAVDPALKMLAKKTGTYFVSIEAPDPIDPDDPSDQPPNVEPYKLTLSKVAAPKPKKKTARKKRTAKK